MKKIKHFFSKKEIAAVSAFVIGLAASVNYGLRTTYVFIDIVLFKGFGLTLLSLAIIAALFLLLCYILKVKKGSAYTFKLPMKVLYIVSLAYSLFFFIYTVGVYIGSGVETQQYANQLILQAMPLTFFILSIVFLAVVMPNIQQKTVKKVISFVLVLCAVGGGILSLFPYCEYKITSDPMVIDNGEDYAVVFATNDNGTGFIEYEFNGESFIKYDESAGRLKTESKIHTIHVPKEQLNSNSYRVGSKRVIADLSYGSRLGKKVYSDYYEFSIPDGDDQSYLTVSDWHIRLAKAYAACENAGDYNGVILLGDPAAGLMTEQDIVTNIVEFGGALSKGIMPVIYVRGNHETRGAYASKLADYLGMDGFYFDTSYGPYEFIVLDSGEDKEDSHPEYGGLDNYNEYRKDMISWLSQKKAAENKKTFVLVHSNDVCIEENLSKKAYDNFNRLGVVQLLSGHMHTVDFFEKDGINVYIDGGIMDGKEFVANKLTLNADNCKIEGWNQSGEKVFDKTLKF